MMSITTKYAFSYVSNNDAIEPSTIINNFYTSLSYNYENGIEYLEPQLISHKWCYYSFIFNDNHSGGCFVFRLHNPLQKCSTLLYILRI